MKGSFRQPESYTAALLIGLILLTGCGRGVDQDAPPGSPIFLSENEIRFTDNEIPQPVPPPLIESARINSFNPDAVRVTWLSGLAGDVDGDGEVAGTDVFPLAIHYLENSNHGGHVADRPGADCADANRDGLVDGADLFVIAAEFGVRVEDYRVWKCDRQVGAYQPLDTTSGELPPRENLQPCMRRWEIVDESEADKDRWYAVTSISSFGEESVLSNRGQAVEEEGEWIIEEFAKSHKWGRYRMDSAPSGGICQYWTTGDEQKLARETESGWETTDAYVLAEQNRSVTAGSNGCFGIAGGLTTSMASWYDGSQWRNHALGDVGILCTMEFASDNQPLLASLRNYSYYSLGLARYDGLIWDIQGLDSHIQLNWPGLCVDVLDRPWIAYSKLGEGLWLARENEPGWINEVIDENLVVQLQPIVMRMNQAGMAWIVYAAEDELGRGIAGIRATRGSPESGWTSEYIVKGELAGHVTMRLDRVGRPLVGYLRKESGEVVVSIARWTDEGWVTHQLARLETSWWLAAVGFDLQGYPLVGWLDTENEVIYNARYR